MWEKGGGGGGNYGKMNGGVREQAGQKRKERGSAGKDIDLEE